MRNELDKLLADIEDGDALLRELAEPHETEAAAPAPPQMDFSAGADIKPGAVPDLFPTEKEKAVEAEPQVPEEPVEICEPPESEFLQEESSYNIPGTRSWNQGEPYTVSLSEECLRRDVQRLRSSYYFIDGSLSEVQAEHKIHKAMIDFMRNPSQNILEEYRSFVLKCLSEEQRALCDYFEVSGDATVFMYHLGPQSLFQALFEHFSETGVGFCHQYLAAGKGNRFFPAEYLKEATMVWFDERIHSQSIDFDSEKLLDIAKSQVMRKYYEDRKSFNATLERINLKVGPKRSISGAHLLKMKGGTLFGHGPLQAYRRFVGNNLFL